MKDNPSRSALAIAASCAILLMAQMNSPAQTLLNRWSFNAPAGSLSVTDSVAGSIAELNGDATLDGTNLNLDGSSGTYVTLSSNLLAGVEAVSCEGWADAETSPDNVCLFSFDDGAGTGAAYARYVIHDGNNTDNQFELADFGSTTTDPGQQLKSPVGWGGVPVHVVCVYDPTAGIQGIYTNGILEAFRTFPVNQTTLSSVSSDAAALGRSPWWADGDPYLAGTIREFRIWNGRLDDLQIAALDAAGPGTVSTNYGAVTNLELVVTYQMTQHAIQQAVVFASASALSVKPDIASLCNYTSGNTNILTVSATGAITAVAPGSTTVTAFFGAISNSQTVTVAQPVAVLS
ncbi:MAG: Ig-like domain-containing protein, partial [Verrucomicrobiae bacterium]|nr:Ig-like domain-containing protein [Verrucomicrobiae bacterium]